VQIANNAGKIVAITSFFDASSPSLNVDCLTPGVYHLLIQTTDGETSSLEFVKD